MKQKIKDTIRKNKYLFGLIQKTRFFLNKVFNNKYFYALSRSTKPLSSVYGLDRGTAVDRYYIESFLRKNKKFITGKCLEVLNDNYTRKFGENVSIADVLDIEEGNPKATIVGDLRKLSSVEDNTYDCLIITQTFHLINDYEKSISESFRILKKGGVLLVSLPCISRIDVVAGSQNDFWRFTPASTRYVFHKYFDPKNVQTFSYGNVLACVNFLVGSSAEEVGVKKLEDHDVNFPLTVCVVAIK